MLLIKQVSRDLHYYIKSLLYCLNSNSLLYIIFQLRLFQPSQLLLGTPFMSQEGISAWYTLPQMWVESMTPQYSPILGVSCLETQALISTFIDFFKVSSNSIKDLFYLVFSKNNIIYTVSLNVLSLNLWSSESPCWSTSRLCWCVPSNLNSYNCWIHGQNNHFQCVQS